MRACRDLGMGAVAVYSDADRDALHVRLADEAFPLGAASPRESYSSIEKLIAIARRSGCDAVHPGYGFLSENADFAEAVTAAGIAFIGPPAEVQRLLGEKTQARRLAKEAGVPIAEGANEPLRDIGEARAVAARVGYPVMLKAAGGGGGKGMRIVRSAEELEAAWRVATGEASAAFGTPALFLERLIEGARHIEMQLIADQHGNVVWLGERDCSTPTSPSEAHRRIARSFGRLHAPREARRRRRPDRAIRQLCERGHRGVPGQPIRRVLLPRGQHAPPGRAPGHGAGHGPRPCRAPIPRRGGEATVRPGCGGSRRGVRSSSASPAEDARAGFVPSTGRIALLRLPAGPGVRVDHALFDGMTVPTEYDPLLAKIVVWGRHRAEAVARARRAVRETIVAGLATSLPFHAHALADRGICRGLIRHGIRWLRTGRPPTSRTSMRTRLWPARSARSWRAAPALRGSPKRRHHDALHESRARGRASMRYEVGIAGRTLRVDVDASGRFLVDGQAIAAEVTEPVRGRQWLIRIGGRSHEVTLLAHEPTRLSIDGIEVAAGAVDERSLAASRGTRQHASGRHELRAPMPGLLRAVHVKEGDVVERDAPLVTLEAMKMENELRVPARARVGEALGERGREGGGWRRARRPR